MEILMTRADDDLGEGLYDSVAWCFSAHLKEPDKPGYRSALFIGPTEDCPTEIQFFRKAEPTIHDKPARIWRPAVEQDEENGG